MKNKCFEIIRPHTYEEFTYSFTPYPVIILNGCYIGTFDRRVSIQLGWLCFGLKFSFEYSNKWKMRKMAREWETEDAGTTKKGGNYETN